MTQYGATTGDTVIPQAYAGISFLFPSPPAVVQTSPFDVETVPTPIVSNYTLSPSTMGLSPGNYKFIAITHKAHFNYSMSAPPVFNREELQLYQGNNIQVITFTVT
jgi:hypothetical protein